MRMAIMLALAVVTFAASALAQTPSSQDRALAESLFREARKLAKVSDYDAACPKYAESHRLDPQLGTLLHLATCHEAQGKTASAWAEFSAATELAELKGEKRRIKLARDRADALEPNLSRLKVHLAQSADQVTVELDGRDMAAATLATPFPIDPGDHRISAVGVAGASWKQAVRIPEGAGVTAVHVPLLDDTPDDAGDAAPPDDNLTTYAWIAGGVGVAGLGVMTIFGVVAASQSSDADGLCEGRFCSDEGLEGHKNAENSATIATVGLILGLTGIATAATLFIIAPSPTDQQEAYWIEPSFSTDGAMLRAGLVW
jgi:hypothetical protein